MLTFKKLGLEEGYSQDHVGVTVSHAINLTNLQLLLSEAVKIYGAKKVVNLLNPADAIRHSGVTLSHLEDLCNSLVQSSKDLFIPSIVGCAINILHNADPEQAKTAIRSVVGAHGFELDAEPAVFAVMTEDELEKTWSLGEERYLSRKAAEEIAKDIAAEDNSKVMVVRLECNVQTIVTSEPFRITPNAPGDE